MPYRRNATLQNEMLPVDVVLGPPWWHRHEGLSFDEDFFFHPTHRVEVERRKEQALHDRWGRLGLGADRDRLGISPRSVSLGLMRDRYLAQVRYTPEFSRLARALRQAIV